MKEEAETGRMQPQTLEPQGWLAASTAWRGRGIESPQDPWREGGPANSNGSLFLKFCVFQISEPLAE